MNEHLTDEQITESLLGAIGDAAGRQHLADCRECGEELARMRTGITGFADVVHDQAEQRQLRPVRVETAAMHSSRLVWAAALVLLAVALSLLRWTPAGPPEEAAAARQSDDTLLLEIQQDLNRD